MTVPFLIEFVPYKLNGEACQSIDDMVAISLQQSVPVSTISYNIGSSDDINIPLTIQNITNNAELEIAVIFDSNIFIIDGVMTPLTLLPGEVQPFVVRLNKSRIDQSLETLLTSIKFQIKNKLNGTTVTKNASTSILTVNSLTDTVDISS
jgi:hypothetical protein